MTALFRKDKLKSINPATQEMVGEVMVTPPGRVKDIVAQAHQGFLEWKNRPPYERSKIMLKAQQLLLERSGSVAEMITLEMGRPFVESLADELEAGIDLIGYYAKRADKFLRNRRVPLHNVFFFRRGSSVHFQPLGVLGIISPWNWPLLIPLGGIVPALLSGNAVVFKPSELTPLVGVMIHQLFIDAGIPESVFQVIQGDGHVGHALVQSDVEKIFFTGSTEVGQKVMETAARSLKKCVLEMGGSDPAIVCEDANLNIASSGIVWGGFNNCGQNCNSIERVYVNYSIIDEFMELLVRKTEQLRVGDGMRDDVDMGPMVSENQVKKIEKLIKKAVHDGAEIRCGGRAVKNMPGYFFEPTILYSSEPMKSFFDEEIFGPVIMVTPVKDDEEAVRLANNSSFGLAASVWTRRRRRGMHIARQIETGSVMINDVIVSFGMTEAGWTGIKNSGIGWVHGEKGLEEMVNIQYINYDPQHKIQKIWWFPYGPSIIEAMKAGMDFLFHRNLFKKLKAIPKVLQHFTQYLILNSKRKGKL